MVNLKQFPRPQSISAINESPLPTLATYQQPDTFGDYLRYLRRQARLTQTDLGIAVGYSPGQISLLESNQRSPNPTAVAALFLPALGIESDPHASNHLIALAHAAQEKNDTPLPRSHPANGVDVLQQVEVVIEKTLLPRPSDVHSLLESIPPEPVHVVVRQTQLTQLQQWYQRERAVAICGLAGMGKSTLAAHFARGYAQNQPVLWLTLVADTNLSPEAILSQVALFVATYSRDNKRMAAYFRKAEEKEPAHPFHQQVVMIATALDSLDSPLLVLDDAHLLSGQPQIIHLLQRLFTLAPRCRLLFVTREEIEMVGVHHLNLSGLERAEAEELLGRLLGSAWLGTVISGATTIERVRETLLAATAHSPLLLRLAVSHLEQQSTLDLTTLAATLAPALVKSLVDTIDPSARRLIYFLAIWRDALDLTQPGLAEVLSEGQIEYNQRVAIASLQRRRLIDSITRALPHPLLRESLQREINSQPSLGRELHTYAAHWATHIGDRIEATHHYLCANDLHNAIRTITSQPAESYHRGRGMAAAAVIEEVLAVVKRANDGRWTVDDVTPSSTIHHPSSNTATRTLLILHGDLLANTTRADDALASYYEAMALTTQTVDRALLAEKMAMNLYRRGQMDEAVLLCEQALDMLSVNITPSGVRQRIQIEMTRLKALLALTRFEEARTLCESALSLVKPLALIIPSLTDMLRAYSNMALGYMARFEGKPALASEYLRKSVKHARAARLTTAEIDALALLGCAQRDLGNFANAEVAGQQALDLAYATSNDYGASQCLHFLSLVSYNQYELAIASERTQGAQQIKELIGDFEGLVACRLVETLILTSSHQLERAEICVNRAVTDSQLLENPWLRSLAYYAASMVQTFCGNLSEAERTLRQALAEKSPSLDLPYLASMQTFWGYIYVAQARFDEALRWIDEPVPVGGGLDVEMMRGVIKGMALLGKGERQACRNAATQLAKRARHTGHLVYAVEAERLIELIDSPPPVDELVRRVCCG